MLELIKRGFYLLWQMDLIIFLVVFIGILLLLLVAWIYGRINKSRKNIDDDKSSKNP